MTTASQSPNHSTRRRLWWGGLGLAFFFIHAFFYVKQDEPENILWVCHLACALAGLAWLAGSARLNAIALLWIFIGLPLWVVDVLKVGWDLPTSVLTHFGGLVVALAGLREFGFPRGVWWQAVLLLLVMNLLCRVITPAAANVNVAFAAWRSPASTPQDHFWYVVKFAAGLSAGFFLLEQFLRRKFSVPAVPAPR